MHNALGHAEAFHSLLTFHNKIHAEYNIGCKDQIVPSFHTAMKRLQRETQFQILSVTRHPCAQRCEPNKDKKNHFFPRSFEVHGLHTYKPNFWTAVSNFSIFSMFAFVMRI